MFFFPGVCGSISRYRSNSASSSSVLSNNRLMVLKDSLFLFSSSCRVSTSPLPSLVVDSVAFASCSFPSGKDLPSPCNNHRGSQVSEEGELLLHKFMQQVHRIFNKLPKPLEWRSFYTHDLKSLVQADHEGEGRNSEAGSLKSEGGKGQISKNRWKGEGRRRCEWLDPIHPNRLIEGSSDLGLPLQPYTFYLFLPPVTSPLHWCARTPP